MKKTYFLLLASVLITFTSCENAEKKTIKIYCETVNKAVSDTTISYSSISYLEEKTYNELILKNDELKNNTEFINSFKNNDDVKELQKSVKAKIIQNVQNILKKNIFVTGVDNRWQVHKLTFDGIMVNIISVQVDLRGSYETENKTKKYTVTLEENGKAYINSKRDNGEDLTFEFGKNKTDYYIAINERVYFSPIDKSKKTEKEVETEEETNESSYDTLPKETETDLGGPAGDIVVGIKDKVYFYDNSNSNSKTSAYFVKGQKAEFIEISDDNLEDDFLYVNFEHNGKVKAGYVLRSDVKFE